ncbi:hypothetical protein TIFTF001_042627 [Ficus carica]|uniref:Uncharacterized protein n=1 Tax=Ficus carica TaxID=3494 RepID=A0AA88A174_FICCA|nr:hypothetical protein TIFTF001_042627 [Ficus carica]
MTSWCYHLQLASLEAVGMNQGVVGGHRAGETPGVSAFRGGRTLSISLTALSLELYPSPFIQSLFPSPLLINALYFASKGRSCPAKVGCHQGRLNEFGGPKQSFKQGPL